MRAARYHGAPGSIQPCLELMNQAKVKENKPGPMSMAIARMLLKDPAVVVLDEATSSLDSENEAAIQAALSIALEGRTAIVIAHRLSTITGADRIVVVDGGRVVESGRHDDLLDDGGLYADLYRTLVGSTFA